MVGGVIHPSLRGLHLQVSLHWTGDKNFLHLKVRVSHPPKPPFHFCLASFIPSSSPSAEVVFLMSEWHSGKINSVKQQQLEFTATWGRCQRKEGFLPTWHAGLWPTPPAAPVCCLLLDLQSHSSGKKVQEEGSMPRAQSWTVTPPCKH